MDYPCSICCIAGYRTLFPPPQQTASRLGSRKSDGFVHPANHHYGATIMMAIVSFWHLLPRKQLCPKGEKRKIGKTLLRILRHFGGFILTSFLGMIIVGIATFIAALPSIILIIAQFYSQLGALDGDPLGVPGYFTPLLFLVFTITFLLIIYALSWLGISLAYQFGSYKVQDEEKQRMKESQKMATTEIEKY